MKRKCGKCPVVLFCISRGAGEWNKMRCSKCRCTYVFRRGGPDSISKFFDYKAERGVNLPKCGMTKYGLGRCERCWNT